MILVNEGSSLTVEAIPLDEDGAPFTPVSMRYRIDCLTTGREVLGYTSISVPSTSNLIVVTGALNAIINQGNARERRQITVETTSSQVRNDTIDWEVRNIYGVR